MRFYEYNIYISTSKKTWCWRLCGLLRGRLSSRVLEKDKYAKVNSTKHLLWWSPLFCVHQCILLYHEMLLFKIIGAFLKFKSTKTNWNLKFTYNLYGRTTKLKKCTASLSKQLAMNKVVLVWWNDMVQSLNELFHSTQMKFSMALN